MRAIENAGRSEAGRPGRAPSPSVRQGSGLGRLAGQGEDLAEAADVPGSPAPACEPAGPADPASRRAGERHGPDRPVAAACALPAPASTPAEPLTDASAGRLFPAQSAVESGFDHPFADGDGHLFDQSTKAPAQRERRRAPREQSPTQRALGLLVRREHSRKELTRKLTSRGLEREDVVEAVDRLAEAGWQDDARFAESLVRSRANNGYGPVHIRAELGTHGLDGEAIAAAMAAFEGDWLQNARDLLRRRFGEAYAQDPARRRKAADLLMRRGFEMETIRIASRSYASD